jgi:adenylyltransferase/sulfurtransferase
MSAMQPEVERITPSEVRDRLSEGEPLRIIDVREPIEFQIARIEGSELIPLAELPRRLETLDRDQELILVCHLGIRSYHACAYLRENGFARARNLVGGIDRWSIDVDPTVPRY